MYMCMHMCNSAYTIFLLFSTENENGRHESKLIILLEKIEHVEKSIKKISERMDKLETTVIRLQQANAHTQNPLPPPNKTKQRYPMTQEVSLEISPGFFIPAKLTDL